MARDNQNTLGPANAKAGEGALPVRLSVRKCYKMFIGGAFVRSESGRYFQVAEHLGAANSSVVMENIPWASRKDARDAVSAARNAWDGWANRTAFNRGQIIYRLAEMLEGKREELILSLEKGGLSKEQAELELNAAIDRTIVYAGWTDKYQSLFSSLNPTGGPHFTFTVPEPMGVVAIVAPERPSLLGLVSTILPVIVSGNTCVVAAGESDPRTAIVLGECIATSDMPGGVVNILTGPVKEVLVHLAKHMEVAALDLHGVDAELARNAEALAASNVKRVRSRSLSGADFFDAQKTESPRWIERFVEMKTIWHPSGM